VASGVIVSSLASTWAAQTLSWWFDRLPSTCGRSWSPTPPGLFERSSQHSSLCFWASWLPPGLIKERYNYFKLGKQAVFIFPGSNRQRAFFHRRCVLSWFQIAARTLGDLVRKLGEKILPEIIPILEEGLRSDKSDKRQGVCIGLSEIMKSTSKDAVSHAAAVTHDGCDKGYRCLRQESRHRRRLSPKLLPRLRAAIIKKQLN